MPRSRGQGEGPLAEDPSKIFLNSRVPYAHDVLKDILAERRGNWFKGVVRNFRRNKGKGLRWTLSAAAGLVAGGVTLILTHDPAAALAAGTAGMGMPTLASTAHVRKSRLEADRRGYPDMPEFRDDWAVACYELMRMISGFNLRVAVIGRLRRMAEETDDDAKSEAMSATADAMSDLLREWRQELLDVADLLGSYGKSEIDSVLTDIQTVAIIRNLNPLKDGRYEWLCLDPEIIPAGHEQEFHDRDIREIAAHHEIADALDPYEAIRRDRLKRGEPID